MSKPSDVTSDERITRRLNTEQDDPATQIVEIVADLDDGSPLNLPPIYRCIDDLIADLFSSPPSAEADACIVFSYEGYRIRVQQDGMTTFRELST
ncbi:HalOD1 output domain-containing protein [Natrinema sp. 74]|uniref:HalOD1 output domain-containing protein n=1 Tax=Natrinema sp. 74 TaxID=3384159 RepID=UPI0038D4C2E4